MNSEYIYIIIILIALITLFFGINTYLKKNIEQYGIYCGRYNIKEQGDTDNRKIRRRCMADDQCKWNDYKSANGVPAGWCGQNPDGSHTEDTVSEES